MLNKEEIEKAKERCNSIIEFCKNNKECQENNICSDCYIEIEDIKAMKTLLQYIDQLEQENNKQSKMIDEMTMEIASSDNYDTFCKEVYPNNSCEGNGIPCWDCVKQYFEKKVEEK